MKTYRALAWACVALLLLSIALAAAGFGADRVEVLLGAGVAFLVSTALFVAELLGFRRVARERAGDGLDGLILTYLCLNLVMLGLLATVVIAWVMDSGWALLAGVVVGGLAFLAVAFAVGVVEIILGVKVRALADDLYGLRGAIGWTLIVTGLLTVTSFAASVALVPTIALTLLLALLIHRHAGGGERPFSGGQVAAVFALAIGIVVVPAAVLVVADVDLLDIAPDGDLADEPEEDLPAERPLPGLALAINGQGEEAGFIRAAGDKVWFTPGGDALFRSEDRGLSWRQDPARVGTLAFLGVSADGATVLQIGLAGRAALSRDGGQQWEQWRLPVALASANQPMAAAMFEPSLRRGAAVSDCALWTTEDGGRRWTRVYASNDPKAACIEELLIDGAGQPMWARGQDNGFIPEDYVWRGTDGGRQWTRVCADLAVLDKEVPDCDSLRDTLPPRFQAPTSAFAERWSAAEQGIYRDRVWAVDTALIERIDGFYRDPASGRLWATLHGQIAYTDDDRRWTGIYEPAPYGDGFRFSDAERGIFLVRDECALRRSVGGHGWTPVPALSECVRDAADAGGRIHALDTKGAVWISEDLGEHWRVLKDTGDADAYALRVSADGQRLFVFNNEGRVHFSVDGGAAWRTQEVDVEYGDRIHCGDACWIARERELRKLTPGPDGLKAEALADLAELLPPDQEGDDDWVEVLWFDASGNNGVIGSSMGRLLRSQDGGASWSVDPPRRFGSWSLQRSGGDTWLLGERGVMHRLGEGGVAESLPLPSGAYGSEICVLPSGLIAVTVYEPDGEVFTTDRGVSWSSRRESVTPCYLGKDVLVAPGGLYRLTASP